MHKLVSFVVAATVLIASAPGSVDRNLVAAPTTGSWSWPVFGPVIRGFDPPSSPFGTGHRGIDIGAPVGSLVRAPAPGVVYFAGRIGAEIFLGVDHGAGLRTTYSWLGDLLVAKGDRVVTGQPIAYSGWGHLGDPAPSLHFGVKLDGQYVDPMIYLLPLNISDLIRLAPL